MLASRARPMTSSRGRQDFPLNCPRIRSILGTLRKRSSTWDSGASVDAGCPTRRALDDSQAQWRRIPRDFGYRQRIATAYRGSNSAAEPSCESRESRRARTSSLPAFLAAVNHGRRQHFTVLGHEPESGIPTTAPKNATSKPNGRRFRITIAYCVTALPLIPLGVESLPRICRP